MPSINLRPQDLPSQGESTTMEIAPKEEEQDQEKQGG